MSAEQIDESTRRARDEYERRAVMGALYEISKQVAWIREKLEDPSIPPYEHPAEPHFDAGRE